jgi:hypothetical protein
MFYIGYVDNDCFQICHISYFTVSRLYCFAEHHIHIVVLYVWYVHFRNILFPVHLFTFMNIYYMCSMYISGGGGVQVLILAS